MSASPAGAPDRGPRTTRSRMAAVCRRFVAFCSLVVPAKYRRDWRREWESEIAYADRNSMDPLDRSRSRTALLRHAAGAPADALSLLREEWNLDMIRHDISLAFRGLVRRPGFTAVAILTLALAIGASTAIFSIVNTVLLEPLPYARADELVRIFGTDTVNDSGLGNLNPLDVRDWGERAEQLAGIASVNTGTMTFTADEGPPRRLETGLGSANFFDVLGVEPLLGRTFAAGEDEVGNHRVAVLDHAFWQQQFAASPDVIGSSLTLSGVPYRIIGVLGPEFISPVGGAGDPQPALWRPLAYEWDQVGRGGHFMFAIARLGGGVTRLQAQAEIDTLAAATAAEFPANALGRGAALVPLYESMVGDARPTLLLMSGAVALLLLIACGNVANLVLARGVGRRHELAVRTALGAGRARLLRQLVTESVVVATLAGALGLALARGALGIFIARGAGDLPRLESLHLDLDVLLFAIAVSLATAVAFGLVPALVVSRRGLGNILKGHADTSLAKAQSRLRSTLVVAEVALSTVLLAGAALMVQSLWGLLSVDAGFDPDDLLTVRVSLSGETYDESPGRIEFYRRLTEELGTLPGVARFGAVNMLPFTDSYSCDSFGLEDRPAPPEGEEPCAETRVVTPGYFDAIGIPLIRGRTFTESDNQETNPVVLINQAMADEYWPDGDALGQRFKYGSYDAEGEPWRTIVGIIGNARHFGFREQMRPEVYFPYPDWAWSSMYLVLRADGPATNLVGPVRNVVQRIDSSLPVYSIATMEDRMAETVVSERLATRLLLSFAAVALALASVGLYGVLAYNISLRTREIGLRMALGAERADVVALVVRHGALLATIGVGLGVAGALAAGGLLSGFLYDVSATDPRTLGFVGALLLIAAVAASWIPARRAARVDPLLALRAEQ